MISSNLLIADRMLRHPKVADFCVRTETADATDSEAETGGEFIKRFNRTLQPARNPRRRRTTVRQLALKRGRQGVQRPSSE